MALQLPKNYDKEVMPHGHVYLVPKLPNTSMYACMAFVGNKAFYIGGMASNSQPKTQVVEMDLDQGTAARKLNFYLN